MTSEPAGGEPAHVRFVVGAPEQLFGVSNLVCAEDGMVSATIPTGAWLRADPSDGHGTLGALGLVADTVFGHANHVVAPPGLDWSVTTQLSLELVGDVPADGQVLVASARAAGPGQAGALSRGEIRDGAGSLVAVGVERGRFVADGPPAAALASGSIDHGEVLPELSQTSSLGDLLCGGLAVGGEGVLTVSPRLTNPRGMLHGGTSFAMVDLIASAATPGDRRTTSVQVAYLRPLVGGGELHLKAVPIHQGRSLVLVDVQGRSAVDDRLVFTGRVVRE